jgi:general secretion pathway protein D
MLALGSATLASPAAQSKAQTVSRAKTQEERQKELERLLQEMKKTSQTQPAQTQAQPAEAPTGMPSLVQRPPLTGNQLQLSYDNADLYAFITQIADVLGITPILIDPEVKGTVTIHSSAPIAKEDVFPIFNLILKNNNAALVTTGEVYQIIPISQGLKQGLKVVMDLPPEPPATQIQAKEEIKKEETPPVTEAKPPVTEAKPPVTEAKPPVTEAKPPVTEAKPPVTGAKPPVTEAKPPVTQTGTVPVGGTNPPAGGGAQTATVAATSQKTQPAAQEQPETPVLATHVIRVEFVPVQSLIEPIKLFMSDGSVIMPYDRLNMLIITDYSDSVQKLLDVIRILDASYLDSELVDLVEIKYNLSADVLTDLQKVFGSGAETATGIYMVSLDRINSIMIMANSKRALEEVKRWITRLDSTTGRSVQTYIYTVKNSTASNIAMVLSLLFSTGDTGMQTTGQQGTAVPGGMLGTQGGTGTRGVGGTGTTNVAGGSRNLTSATGQSSFAGGSMFGGGAQGYSGSSSPYGLGAGMLGQQNVGGPRLGQNYGYSAQFLNGGQFVGLQGMVRIVADDINNALIIQASSADYQYLLETIEKMDVLPRQAIIDARIFEIDLTDDLSFGVSAALQARSTEDHLTTGSLSSATGALTVQTFAFIGSAREILLGLDALRQKTRVRILEAPSVLALDGTPARINVGGSIPVPTQTYVAPAGGATTGVSYRETGTSLLITPRISASGTVTLNVYQEVSSQGAQTPNGPSFNQTAVETTLAVMDGQSVAIAGLIRESDSNARNGVPFLADIPVLGSLFGRTSRSSTRSEILILITPHVIKDADRFQELTDEIKDSLRNVRKYVDEKQKEILSDQEKARKERFEQEQKAAKKVEPPPPIKK